jgi:hypothetical protein
LKRPRRDKRSLGQFAGSQFVVLDRLDRHAGIGEICPLVAAITPAIHL